jgi:hypothetical protein
MGGIMADFQTRATALIVSIAISATGACASTGGARVATVAPDGAGASRAVLTEFVQKLPAGAAIRVDRASGRSVRGTLLKATPQSLFVQPRTRLPEAMVQIPMADVLSVTPETRGGGHIGRAIGAGAAAGAGAALAVFLVIVAAFND